MDVPDKMYINGRWCPSSNGSSIEIINPATEETVGRVPSAGREDLDTALAASQAGWQAWKRVDAWGRSSVLRRVAEGVRRQADLLADVLTEEQGKPLRESRSEVAAAVDVFDWYADEARRIYGRTIDGHSRTCRLIVVKEPIGPVAAFTPWNFPLLLPSRKIAAALAAGCSMILKPAREAPRTALLLARICHEADLPPGALNVVTGESSFVSRYLIASEVIRKVTLTGSVSVGRELLRYCADRVIPASMELGGHAPVLVFADYDPERAAEICAYGKFRNMGQVCIAASRFYVHDSVYDRFVSRFVEVAASLRIGNGRDPQVDVGPLANARRLKTTEELVQDALAKGARLLCGGRRPAGFVRGFFYEPTVIADVDPSMRVMREEPFCPIAPIARFRTLEEGLEKANATEYGLAGYIFTDDMRTAVLASEGLETGMVGINNLVIASAEIPFGGIKASGFGREGGSEGIEAYTITKYIHVNLQGVGA